MRISTEQLKDRLAGGLAPLYAVFGEEMLLAIEASDAIRARARAEGYAEREVLSAESGFRWSELAFVARARSLFGSRRLLELRIPSGKPGVEGAEALQAYCGALPEDTVTLVTLPGLDWRSQRAAWFEALERTGVVVEARRVPRRALPDWIAARLRAQGQEAERETLEFIADRVEGNLLAARQEVEKLGLLLPAGRIGHEQARAAVLDVSRHDVSALGEALLEGEVARIARAIEGLRDEGVGAPLVLWAIAEEARVLARVLAGLEAGKPLAQACREARVRGAAHQELVERNVRRFGRDRIEAVLAHAARADRLVKGLARGDAWHELLLLALRFARGAPGSESGKRGRMEATARGARSDQPTLF
jgi:DNA polymerase-3 subunit delta